MAPRYCAVPNCYKKNGRQFYLPVTKKILPHWLDRIGDDSLKTKSFSQIRNLNLHICATHFADMCKTPHGKLKRYALPTLNLPKHYKSTMETCFMFKTVVPKLEKLEETPDTVIPDESNCSFYKKDNSQSKITSTVSGLLIYRPPPKLKVFKHGLKTYTAKHPLFKKTSDKIDSVTPSTSVEYGITLPNNSWTVVETTSDGKIVATEENNKSKNITSSEELNISSQNERIKPEIKTSPGKATINKNKRRKELEESSSPTAKRRKVDIIVEALWKMHREKEGARERRHRERLEYINKIFNK